MKESKALAKAISKALVCPNSFAVFYKVAGVEQNQNPNTSLGIYIKTLQASIDTAKEYQQEQ